MSLYERLKAAGCSMSNHESDLYVRVDVTATAIIQQAIADKLLSPGMPKTFANQAEAGAHWYDIPFMFEPWWTARQSVEA